MINPEDLLPNDDDMCRMRAAVAAYVAGDREGIDLALAQAQAAGRTLQFLAAHWAQMSFGYDLLESDRLADWRNGILFHLHRKDTQTDD